MDSCSASMGISDSAHRWPYHRVLKGANSYCRLSSFPYHDGSLSGDWRNSGLQGLIRAKNIIIWSRRESLLIIPNPHHSEDISVKLQLIHSWSKLRLAEKNGFPQPDIISSKL